MSVTIMALMENSANRVGLIAEHGLSFLVRTSRGTVLFDTGQTSALLANATRLGVDLKEVDRIVLSHGHYDHTGGLRSVLEQTDPREVLAHPAALEPKFTVRGGEILPIGLPESRGALEAAGARWRMNEGPSEVVPGIIATGEVSRDTEFETVPERFRVRRDDRLVLDPLTDDQALIVETGEGPVVLLGCAHSGLINVLRQAARLTGGKRFAAVVGGTHLVDADPPRLRDTVDALAEYEIARMAPCHCTGLHGQAALLGSYGSRYVVFSAGDTLEFRG